MAVFSEGGITTPDIYIGVSCICVVLICTLLNGLVFVHEARKKNSLARSLYLTLSAADFITAWVLTANFAIAILKEKVEECRNSVEPSCNEEYFKKARIAHLGDKVHGIIGWTVVLAPSNVTAFLAMSRYYQIRYPLQRPRIKLVMSGLFLSLIILPVIAGCAMLDVRESENSIPVVVPIASLAWNFDPRVLGIRVSSLAFFFLMTGVTWLLQVGAISTSFLTIYELVQSHMKPKSGGPKRRKTRSSLKILITNVGSVIILGFYATIPQKVSGSESEIGLKEGISYFLQCLAIPSIMSTLNPIIYIALTPKCSFRYLRVKRNPVKPKVEVNVQNNSFI